MKNWLIKLLGGYTYEEMSAMQVEWFNEVDALEAELLKARKNDNRDPKTGRFKKAGD